MRPESRAAFPELSRNTRSRASRALLPPRAEPTADLNTGTPAANFLVLSATARFRGFTKADGFALGVLRNSTLHIAIPDSVVNASIFYYFLFAFLIFNVDK